METSTKERLTGALILVAALVVLIPELLSGRQKPDAGPLPAQNPEDGAPLHTYDVALDRPAGASAAAEDAPAPVSAAELAAVPPPQTETAPSPPASAPAGAPTSTPATVAQNTPAATVAASPPVTSRSTKPAPTAAAPPKPSPPPASKPAPSTPAASGKWWAQIGTFASRDNAQHLASDLRKAGYTIDVSQIKAQGKDLYRVRAGPVTDKAAATALQARLAAAGHKASLVAP